MGKFLVEIDTDNTAFYNNENKYRPGNELYRILSALGEQVQYSSKAFEVAIRDIDGNKVGMVNHTPPKEERTVEEYLDMLNKDSVQVKQNTADRQITMTTVGRLMYNPDAKRTQVINTTASIAFPVDHIHRIDIDNFEAPLIELKTLNEETEHAN